MAPRQHTTATPGERFRLLVVCPSEFRLVLFCRKVTVLALSPSEHTVVTLSVTAEPLKMDVCRQW